MSAAEGFKALLAKCAECGGPTMALSEATDEMDIAQERFREWVEQPIAEGDHTRLAITALKPLFLASELTNERVMFALALRWAAKALEATNTRQPEVPPGISADWWKALTYDLQELKHQGVPDDDPRIQSILEAAGDGIYSLSLVEVGVEYRLKPSAGDLRRLASEAKRDTSTP